MINNRTTVLEGLESFPLGLVEEHRPIDLGSIYRHKTWTKKHPGARPWEKFKANKIRLFANDKSKMANLCDTVRGCSGARQYDGRGCWGSCFAVRNTRRFHIVFEEPVPQVLDEDLLCRDLADCKQSFVRIGVSGEPSEDWDLTVKTCEVISMYAKLPVVTTRYWNSINQRQLKALADARCVLQISLGALDPWDYLEKRLGVLQLYLEMGGLGVLRLITMGFKDHLRHLVEKQEMLVHMNQYVLETPLRLYQTSGLWRLLDKGRFTQHKSTVTGDYDSQLVSIPMFQEKVGVKECITPCWQCAHRCYTV